MTEYILVAVLVEPYHELVLACEVFGYGLLKVVRSAFGEAV